jgi:hypothetical protein
MEATKRWNYPYYIILGYMLQKGTLETLIVAPLDGCPVTAPHFTSTQDLRSRHVSSALKSLDAPGSHLRPSSLRSWLCASTKEPDDFVVNRRKPRELGAASTPIPLMTWPPRRLGSVLVLWSKPNKPRVRTSAVSRYPTPAPPWFWGSTKNRTRLRLAFLATMRPALDLVRPPGPSSRAYLSLHTSEATQAKTFRTRSSPAPTQIKPQPTPVILGQESVHTMLSITHHTKERPSTGRWTLRFSISPLMSALTTHIVTNS